MLDNNQRSIVEHIENVADDLCQLKHTSQNSYLGMSDKLTETLDNLLKAMFPYHFGTPEIAFDEMKCRTQSLLCAFNSLTQLLNYVLPDVKEAEKNASQLLENLPRIVSILKTDLEAAYEGDPAATGIDEIILTYPAFKAIFTYRIAHELYTMKIPIVPRMMTEHAHRITGIDIHPGATIDKYFFIDHGTGVVIGETTTIGEHVKLYQHVTLGAKSFQVNEDGSLVKGIKRHPDIGNNVVIYAGATILGGDTNVGDNCVIGGNVWLTHSIPIGSKITKEDFKINKSN